MADTTSTYTVVYDTSSAVQAAANIDKLTRSVDALDASVTKSKKDLSGFAGARRDRRRPPRPSSRRWATRWTWSPRAPARPRPSWVA